MIQIYAVFFILALIQGVTEFLPVSSDGHLSLAMNIPFIKHHINAAGENNLLLVNVALHFATLVAILIYMRKDVAAVIIAFFSALKEKNFRSSGFLVPLFLIVATIPAVIVGLFLSDAIEKMLGIPSIAAVLLMLNGLILLSTKLIKPGSRKLEETGFRRSLAIGICQASAILPGVSRSGTTISSGVILGLLPSDAARFSFLMAIPVIAGGAVLEGVKLLSSGIDHTIALPLAVSMLLCGVIGYFCVGLLFAIVRKAKFHLFGYYCLALGAVALVVINVLG